MGMVKQRRKRAISSFGRASSASEAPAGINQNRSQKERQLQTPSKGPLQKYLDGILENSGSSLAFLERHAVGHKVEKHYNRELGLMQEIQRWT